MGKRFAVRQFAVYPALVVVTMLVLAVLILVTASSAVFHWAARNDQRLLVNFLLWYGVKVDARDALGCTPLFSCVAGERIEMAQYLSTMAPISTRWRMMARRRCFSRSKINNSRW